MEFPASVDHLGEMLAFVHQHAEQAGLGRTQTHRIVLASEEALVNIINYAFDDASSSKTLSMSCGTQTDGHFAVVIRDRGMPFNPIEAEIDVELDKPLSERKIGGLGIFLIRRLIDDMHYERIEDQNVLTISILHPAAR